MGSQTPVCYKTNGYYTYKYNNGYSYSTWVPGTTVCDTPTFWNATNIATIVGSVVGGILFIIGLVSLGCWYRNNRN